VKRLAILTAAAALALTPAAAAAPNPGKLDKAAKTRSEKVKKAKPSSARARCAAERRELGPAAFAAKYGKPRTKGSAKAKAKAARAAFGRCVAKTAKIIRAEREAAEDAEADLEDAGDEGEIDGEPFVDDDPDETESPEPDDGQVFVDHDGDGKDDVFGDRKDDDADDAPFGLDGAPDLD
jgi:hypothetical protein